ncbi:MAG TPA: NifU family protein [Gemmatimonadaceae bacterium]|nr:NifU family protein [Gemmatimonadaceae bacterium]
MAGPLRRSRPTVEDRIGDALAQVTIILRLDHAVLELVTFERSTGVAVLRLHGDCPDCEMSVSTLRDGIEAHLRMRVPEVREVRALATDAS